MSILSLGWREVPAVEAYSPICLSPLEVNADTYCQIGYRTLLYSHTRSSDRTQSVRDILSNKLGHELQYSPFG